MAVSSPEPYCDPGPSFKFAGIYRFNDVPNANPCEEVSREVRPLGFVTEVAVTDDWSALILIRLYRKSYLMHVLDNLK